MSSTPNCGVEGSQPLALGWVLIGGVATALAFPIQPVPMWPALSLPLLIFVGPALFFARLLNCKSLRQAGVTAAVFGIGWYFVAGVWIFRVFDALGWVLIWIPIGWVVVFGLAAHVVRCVNFSIWWTWPLLWLAIEFIRSEWSPLRLDWFSSDLDPLNFTWFGLGHPRIQWPVFSQTADLIGGYGLCLTPMLCNLCIAAKINELRHPTPWKVVIAMLIAELGYGVAITSSHNGQEKLIGVGIVQSERFQMETLEDLSRQLLDSATHRIDIVVWPELSFTDRPGAKEHILSLARDLNVVLVAGVEVPDELRGYRNVAWWLPPNGEPAEYFKQQRVPFVEHHPRSNECSTFPLSVNDSVVQVGILICYDMDFPSNPRRAAADCGAELFLMPTLDEITWGGTQHSQHSLLPRLRAIENRRAIVQAATSGVSQIIDSMGQVQSEIPFRLNSRPNRPTPYLEGHAYKAVEPRKDVSQYGLWGWQVAPALSIGALAIFIWSAFSLHSYPTTKH